VTFSPSFRRAILALPLVVVVTACDAVTPTEPGHGGGAGPAFRAASTGPFSTSGRVFDVASQASLSNVSLIGDGLTAYSDANGFFTLFGPTSSPTPRAITFSGAGVVSRQTWLRLPGPDAPTSLIPGTFDLVGFDQMFRASFLRRWVQAPPLLIETRTLQFTDVNASSAVATDDEMSDAEYQSLAADLAWALPILSGSTFPGFATTQRQGSASGATVVLLNGSQITVARVAGLTAATGFWGYGRWQTQGDGTVVAGNLVLDRDFERSSSPFHRSLRAHELGHAMGYNHVTGRASVMNSTARLEPNVFDQQACLIAFQRKPGNRSPDIDPLTGSVNAAPGGLTWGPPIR